MALIPLLGFCGYPRIKLTRGLSQIYQNLAGKYAREMLTKYKLTTCSEMKTPMAPPLKLDKDSNGKSVDVTLYRGMIGSLLYLTASRPNIMYATCLC
ncbi:hypothetical protein OSB04_002597 [Centaurea solstitialis]|uniref:Reverse transcriptase n=1 Tax=Centaurea solstitialis TaxID=347529 RepID=A0AA38WVD6_9ASTR|nr:hypothetical protein OSB04_002597 [Centaurea solstitialis]